MVYLEAEPGTVTVAADYLYGLEDRSRLDHDKWIDAETRALLAEEEAGEWCHKLAERELRAELLRVANQSRERQLEGTWKHRFLMLWAALLVVMWLAVSLIVVPHWAEIVEWFR